MNLPHRARPVEGDKAGVYCFAAVIFPRGRWLERGRAALYVQKFENIRANNCGQFEKKESIAIERHESCRLRRILF
jgi:hypothetical protein